MRAEQVDYGYAIEQAGDGYVISYRQRLRLWLVTIVTLALFLPWGLLLEQTLFAVFPIPLGIIIPLSLVLSIVSARAIARFIDSRRPRPTISITRDFLEANGKRYERRHIRQIYAQAPNKVQNDQPVMADNSGLVALGASGVLGGGGVAVAGLQAGADGIRNTVGLVSHGVVGTFNIWSRSRGWSIWMLYGPKRIRLASRMQPAHANLLAQDLVRLLTAH